MRSGALYVFRSTYVTSLYIIYSEHRLKWSILDLIRYLTNFQHPRINFKINWSKLTFFVLSREPFQILVCLCIIKPVTDMLMSVICKYFTSLKF